MHEEVFRLVVNGISYKVSIFTHGNLAMPDLCNEICSIKWSSHLNSAFYLLRAPPTAPASPLSARLTTS